MQVALRGDVLSPAGAADAAAATDAQPDLAGYLFQDQPPTSPGHVLAEMLVGPGGDAGSVYLALVSHGE